ncbi:hypothetical protein BC342_10570 [Streptomyces olivaceus]|nr:hypothetical protein BC342_10470 [Streptomyces olivaceus]AOW86928.1 hypothetical protein BC342_10570 [Streptomyces olivaceus]
MSTSVINVGRQDVIVVGYTLWLDRDGMWWRRLRWKIRMLFRFGFTHARKTLVTWPPSVSFGGEAWLRDAGGSIQFPKVLQAGSTLRMPHILLNWQSDKRSRPRVAIGLGSGKTVQAEVLVADAFEPIDLDPGYRVYADFEIDTRSDEQARDGADGGPIRVFTSVRSRGADGIHVDTHIEGPEPIGPSP